MKKTILALAAVAVLFAFPAQAQQADTCADLGFVLDDLAERGVPAVIMDEFTGIDAAAMAEYAQSMNPHVLLPENVARVAILLLSPTDIVVTVSDAEDCVRSLLFAPAAVIDDLLAAMPPNA